MRSVTPISERLTLAAAARVTIRHMWFVGALIVIALVNYKAFDHRLEHVVLRVCAGFAVVFLATMLGKYMASIAGGQRSFLGLWLDLIAIWVPTIVFLTVLFGRPWIFVLTLAVSLCMAFAILAGLGTLARRRSTPPTL